jgi:predicted ATPase
VHPFSQAQILAWGNILMQLRGDVDLTQEWAERLLAVTTEYGYAQWLAEGVFMQGWARARRGRIAEGIAAMQQGIAAWRATGAETPRPWALAPLAEVYATAGQIEAGLRLLDEAFAAVAQGERAWEAELYRLKGDLLLNADDQMRTSALTPEACYRRALKIARGQQARAWELRAAMSLSRLWMQQGKTHQARQLLAGIYGWFTEGSDTVDLKTAKALLDAQA